jgi:histidyl-tRNA synthetase
VSKTELYLIVLGENITDDSLQLADQLREEGVRAEVDMTNRKLDKQIKTASKKQIPYVLFIGESEIRTKEYNLKHLNSGVEQTLSLERVVSTVKDQRKNKA